MTTIANHRVNIGDRWKVYSPINYVKKRDTLLSKTYGIIRLIAIIIENIYVVSSYLVLTWVLLLPLSWVRPDLYSRVENYLYNSLLYIVSSWSLAAGITVNEIGDDFSPLIENSNLCNTTTNSDNHNHNHEFMNKGVQQPRLLVLSNHISTSDVPLLMQSLSGFTKQSILWVLDAIFKPTNFGLVCGSHGDFFIAKDTFTEGVLRNQVLKHPDRNLMVLFPEGGFLSKRLEGSNRYAIKNGLATTQHVTHPRFKAFADLISPEVRVTHIVDVTLLYRDQKDPLSILDVAFGGRVEPVFIHYRVLQRESLELSDEWLRSIWMEKEKLIKSFYEDRDKFLEEHGNSMRTTQLDWVKVITVHLFYLLVFYLAVYKLFCFTCDQMMRAKDVASLF